LGTLRSARLSTRSLRAGNQRQRRSRPSYVTLNFEKFVGSLLMSDRMTCRSKHRHMSGSLRSTQECPSSGSGQAVRTPVGGEGY
jgi:hypothetical protein